MQYRQYGSTDLQVSTLGFGLMRLPKTEDGAIDDARALPMVRSAIDQGLNYLDTAYGYHGGESERFTARVMADGYRDKVVLVTKLPAWMVETEADFDRLLTEQLEKLETDYIDVYLLHALTRERWETVRDLGVREFLDRAKADGRIGHTGFSFHDQLDAFKEIVDGYAWDAAMIQLNFMDHEYQAGVAGMKYAADRGLAVAVMEPLRGGKLANQVPDDIRDLWSQTATSRKPADWALRWVCNFPEASVVISGMSCDSHVTENLATVEDALPNSLTEEEMNLIHQVRDIYLSRMQVNCTECGYCIPCPEKVAIPEIFSLVNNAAMYETVGECVKMYASMMENGKGAELCVECGQCEAACPQNIAIIEELKKAHAQLTSC